MGFQPAAAGLSACEPALCLMIPPDYTSVMTLACFLFPVIAFYLV
jgi:hypothetical protein